MKQKVEMKDINWEKLITYIKTQRIGNLPNNSQGIIPPKLKIFEDLAYLIDPAPAFDEKADYWGKSIDELEDAVRRIIESMGEIKQLGIWLSGGIDSSLLAYCAVRVLGPEKVVAYNLTFGGSTEFEFKIAKAVADFLGIRIVHKSMTAKDAIEMMKIGTLDLRAPTICPHVSFISKMCLEDGTEHALIGLNLDALTGGEKAHADAKTLEEFQKVEKDIWGLQWDYAWINIYQSRRYLKLYMPYMDPKFVAYMKSIPWKQKTTGGMTKVRIRQEISARKILPDVSALYGKVGGTKRGFCPKWSEWINGPEMQAWIKSVPELPPEFLAMLAKDMDRNFSNWKRNSVGSEWIVLALASTAEFLEMIRKGEFDYE